MIAKMTILEDLKILKNEEVAKNYMMMEIKSENIARKAVPGQFVHISLNEKVNGNKNITNDPLLRRPFSIHDVDVERGIVKILYKVVGKGTFLLSRKRANDVLSIMGPLGNGFAIKKDIAKAAIVAGGIGVAPMYFLLKALLKNGVEVDFYLGALSKSEILLVDEIKSLGVELHVATDDGSIGEKGRVTDLLHKNLKAVDVTYTCGPKLMMREVVKIALAKGIPVQVSMEEKMACGIGACLSCVCKVKNNEHFEYKRVCAEGPVFDGKSVMMV